MAQNENGNFLLGLLGGATEGLKSRRKEENDLAQMMQQLMLKAQIEQSIAPREWKPTTQQEAIDFEASKDASAGWKPKTKEEAIELANAQAEAKASTLTPSQRKLKDQNVKDYLSTAKTNAVKRQMINDVSSIIDEIPQGKLGSFSVGMMGLKGTDPMLEKIQKVKMVLTDAQLLNTAKTKGAISDKEMQLFADAAANNDFSAKRIKPVLKKLLDFMEADESAMRDSFIINYGEDPAEYLTMGGMLGKDNGTPQQPQPTGYDDYLQSIGG